MTLDFDTFKHNIFALIDEIFDVALESQPYESDYAINKWFDDIDCLYLTSDGTWACEEYRKDLNATLSFNDSTPFYKLLIEKGIHERHDCEVDRIDDDDYAWTLREMDIYPPEHEYQEVLTMLTNEFNELVDAASNTSSDIEFICYEIYELLESPTNMEEELCQKLSELIEYIYNNDDSYDTLHEFLIEMNKITADPNLDICQSNEFVYSYKRYDNGGYTSVALDFDAIAEDIENEIKRYRENK